MAPVSLNHLLVFVDRDTYRALSASGFLNDYFACSEERTTHDQATGMSWTGRYYYGRHTYFEFMNPDKTSWAPRDGLAFGMESAQGTKELARRLGQGTEKKVKRYRRNRRYRNEDVPWFWSLEIPRGDDARLISWVMEYDPGFLGRWAAHLPPAPASGDISRASLLDRYRAAIGDDLPNRLFQDIKAVTVALPSDEADLLETELAIYGYAREEAAAAGTVSDDPTNFGACTTFRGPDLDITVERIPPEDGHAKSDYAKPGNAGEPGGITGFTMETRPVSATAIHTFGPACRLTIRESGRATWSFRENAGRMSVG